MKVQHFMSRRCITCTPEMTVREVGSLMATERVGAVVVLDSRRKPTGIVSKTDLIKSVFSDRVDLDGTPASAVMSPNVVAIRPEDNMETAATSIAKHRVHHLVVVDEQMNFLGIISSWDIAREVHLDAKSWPYSREAFL